MAAAGGTESQASSSSTTKLSLKTCNSDSILSPCNPSLQRDQQGHPQQPLVSVSTHPIASITSNPHSSHSDSTSPRGNHPHLSSSQPSLGSLSQEQHPITINETRKQRDVNHRDGGRDPLISRGDRDEGTKSNLYENHIGEFALLSTSRLKIEL